MWQFLVDHIFEPLGSWLTGGAVFFITNFTTVVGFMLALLIIRRVLSEKRHPSNFFAWFLLVIFFPIIGVPLYFMFGGRKSRKVARIKRAVADAARSLASIDRDALPAEILAPHPYESGSYATHGNRFTLLPDGESAFKCLRKEIESAKETIHIATYILGSDETGRLIVDLLEKRAREGIQVRLLLDSLGCWNRTRAARYKIRRAGGEVAMFMPVLPIQTQISSNLRNHRKIAVFDGQRAITGGQNLDSRFIGEWPDPYRFTDFSVMIEGPAVAELTRTFLADWAFAAKKSPSDFRKMLRFTPEEVGDSTIEVITSGPDVENDPLWEQILRIIQEFKQSLTIITPYFIPDEVLFRSLIVKAHTGRKIRLVLPLKSNQGTADIARYHFLRELHAAGVEILFYTPRMLHGKLILADGKVALLGSANIDMRSLFVNFEIALLHYTTEDIERLDDWAQRVIRDSISYQEALSDKKLMPSRFTQDLVHLFVPLL